MFPWRSLLISNNAWVRILVLLQALLSVAVLGNPMIYSSREWNVQQVLKPIRRGSHRVILVPLTNDGKGTNLDDSDPIRSIACANIHHKKSITLSVILWGRFICYTLFSSKVSMPTWMIRSEGRHRIPFMIIIALLYLLESLFCSTRKYLSNVLDMSALQRLMEQVMSMQPTIKWHIECYHYDTILRKTGSGWVEGNGGTMRAERTKVVTHRAVQRYTYQSSKDNTTPAQLHDIVKESVLETPYLKISFSPIVRFANLDTQQDYQNRLNYFLLMNGRRDQHADFYTTIEFTEHIPSKVLATTTGIGAPKTGLFRSHFFWIFTALGLTVPYRIWFSNHCKNLEVTIDKEVIACPLHW